MRYAIFIILLLFLLFHILFLKICIYIFNWVYSIYIICTFFYRVGTNVCIFCTCYSCVGTYIRPADWPRPEGRAGFLPGPLPYYSSWAFVLCYPKIQYIKSKHHSLTDRCTSKITVRTDLKFGIEVLLIFSPCNKKKFSKMLRFGGVINNYNWYLCVIAPTADPSRLH